MNINNEFGLNVPLLNKIDDKLRPFDNNVNKSDDSNDKFHLDFMI